VSTTDNAAPVAPSVAEATAPTAGRRPGLVTLFLRQGGAETRRFLRSREAVVFTMAFPLLMIFIFGSIFTWDYAPGVKFTQYFVVGMIGAGLMATGFQSLAIQIPGERDRGELKRLRGTPMPPSAYFAGKILMVLAISAMETVVLLVVAVAAYGVDLPRGAQGWLTLGWVGLLGVTACTLCGIAFSSVARTARAAPAVATPVALALQFISGVFFPFTSLPHWMQQVAAIFPLKWLCQGLRAVFLPDSLGAREPAGSWELDRVALVLGAWCVLALVLCLTTFRWTTKRDG
jgi:ABC-2 type transport system permease protein